MLELNFILISLWGVTGQLIRPTQVYESVVTGVHDHFNNTCILLLHATSNPMESKGLENAVALMKLQMYFSETRRTRTAIMDLQTFTSRIGMSYYHIKRPLFVVLNDQDNIQQLLAHVSTWIAMAYPTWIIFFSEGNTIESFFKDVIIPFDCLFLVSENNGTSETITEVYRVAPDKKIRTMRFGSWDDDNGVTTPRLSFYQRRNNLFGETLRVTSIQNLPMSSIKVDKNGTVIGVGGLFGKLLKILEEMMNCTFQYTESKSWGSPRLNGSWGGMVGKLSRGEVDLAASEIVMTPARKEVVDFTIPIVSSRYHTYIKRPDFALVSWQEYSAPFSVSIWGAVGLLIVVASVTMVLIENTRSLTGVGNADSGDYTLTGTVLAVFGAFCSQGMKPSVFGPIKIVHLAIHLTAVIIVAAYSAALVSFLTIQSFTMPFTTMEGLLKEGTYTFGVIPDTAEYNLFSNTSDAILRAMFQQRMEDDTKLPKSYLTGLKRVCKENKYAFMITDTMVSALGSQVDCILEPLDSMLQTSLGMAVVKTSPYRGIINSNILMMRDGGILRRTMRSEWPVNFHKAEEKWRIVQIGDVLPLVAILFGGIILGCILLSVERIVNRHLDREETIKKKLKFRSVPWQT